MYAQSLSHVWLCKPMDCDPAGSSVRGTSQARTPEHFLLQGIFRTKGSNPNLLGLLHWQVDSLPPALPGKPLLKLPGIKYSVSANPCWWSMPFTQFAYKLFFTIYGSLSDYFRFSDIVSISNMGLFQLWSCAFDLPEFTYLVKF